MRINDIIFENSNNLPKVDDIVTDTWVDEIIKTGTWVPHGSSIDDYLEDNDLSHLDNDALRLHLKNKWLPLRYEYVVNQLKNDLNNDIISRCITLTHEEWYKLKPNIRSTPLGIYWSLTAAECHGSESKDVTVTVYAKLKRSDVNWIETIKSRMDYSHGDEEGEIQLYSKAIPTVIDYEVE